MGRLRRKADVERERLEAEEEEEDDEDEYYDDGDDDDDGCEDGFVDLIASGYEWTCSCCGDLNKVPETSTEVTCSNCETTYQVLEVYHATG